MYLYNIKSNYMGFNFTVVLYYPATQQQGQHVHRFAHY